jgi:hypothetical protein
MNFLKIYFWLILPLFFINGSEVSIDSNKTIQHKIVVHHPGEKVAVTVILNQNIDENGLPIAYYMDVESVICLEQVCKVIPVRVFWNNIGEYQKYTLEDGATLEKYEDDFFEIQDYSKLQSILSNKNSPFKDVYLDEILTVPHVNETNADAVSGATALELDEKDTVPGAALTCYTLWHWANGEIVQIIKEITGKSVSNQQLQGFLVDKNQTYYYIALKDLERRESYTKTVVNIIINRVLKDEFLLKSTFNYLKNSPSEIYFLASKEVFMKGETAQKLAVIKSLQSIHFQISKTYLDTLSNEVSKLNSYQEVSFFLDLIDAKNSNSKEVIENVFQLLKSDFIVARRAYWFLKKENLTAIQQNGIDDFYQKNKNKL